MYNIILYNLRHRYIKLTEIIMENKIKAICFDLDGVYFTDEGFRKFRMSFGGDEETYEVFKNSQQIKDLRKGLMAEEEFFDYAKKTLNIKQTNEEIFKTLRECYKVNTEIVELVRKVRKMGYKTCICSDNFDARVRELDKEFDFLKDFDVKVFSYEVGSFKPDEDQKMFKTLIEWAGVDPEEIVYSDNEEHKLVQANALGIKTFVFESVEQFIDGLRSLGVSL